MAVKPNAPPTCTKFHTICIKSAKAYDTITITGCSKFLSSRADCHVPLAIGFT